MWRVALTLTVILLLCGHAHTVHADLNPTTAQRAATKRMPRVKRCYRQTLQIRPLAVGALRVAFEVMPDGTVAERWIALSTAGDSDLETCVLEAFDGLKFPTFEGDSRRIVGVAMLLVTEDIPADVVDKNRELLENKPPPREDF